MRECAVLSLVDTADNPCGGNARKPNSLLYEEVKPNDGASSTGQISVVAQTDVK